MENEKFGRNQKRSTFSSNSHRHLFSTHSSKMPLIRHRDSQLVWPPPLIFWPPRESLNKIIFVHFTHPLPLGFRNLDLNYHQKSPEKKNRYIHNHVCIYLYVLSIWKDLKEDANSGFSLGKGPKNLVVKEMKRLTFYCILIACFFFFPEYVLS